MLPSLLMTLAPDVECEKLCWYSCYSWHSSVWQYPRCSRGAWSVPLHHLHPSSQSNGLTASPTALSLGAAWRNAFLHAEQARAGGHQAQGFRGRLLRVMHNSWPLWTFQLRPLSLMGNPNKDLFIKTISWLFVFPASHRGATSLFNIITSDPSVTGMRFDYIAVFF